MTLYKLVQDVRRKMMATDSPIDSVLSVERIVAELIDAEMSVMARLRVPRTMSYIPVTAASTTYEYRLGQETFPDTQTDSKLSVTATASLNLLQPWTFNSEIPPILNDNVISVEFRPSSSSSYQRLLPTTKEELMGMGVDFETVSSGTTSTYWYLRDNFDQQGSGKHAQVLGLYPQLSLATSDNQAIRITYVPRPTPCPIVVGTGLYWEAQSSVASYYVRASKDSATVYLSDAHDGTDAETAVEMYAGLIAATPTTALPSNGIEAGMMFGIVRSVGGMVREWYTVSSLGLLSAAAGYVGATHSAYASRICNLVLSYPYRQTDAGAYANVMPFVVSGVSLFASKYPAHAGCLVFKAAENLALGLGKPDMSQAFMALYERDIALAENGIFGQTGM